MTQLSRLGTNAALRYVTAVKLFSDDVSMFHVILCCTRDVYYAYNL